MKSDLINRLPVHAQSSEIVQLASQLRPGGCLVLKAEPGSGKTTWVPTLLSQSGVWGNGLVLVTEPRRLAAAGAARYAAHLLGERLGQSIGYAVRGEQSVSAETRVQYVTEGLALQMLADPGVQNSLSCIVLDEFHERHTTLDVMLMLLRHWKAAPRPRVDPPRVVLMSATFDHQRWCGLFPQQLALDVPGQIFPVAVTYRPGTHQPGSPPWVSEVARVTLSALHDPLLNPSRSAGDPPLPANGLGVLVFLPGKGEIRRVRTELEQHLKGSGHELSGVVIEELHGDRTLDDMREAIERPSRRKVFLSTNIAESSLTLKGVRIVIDTGIARVAAYHLKTRATELSLEKIGQHNATQRAGRAGREAPGMVVRLYSEDDFLRRPPEGVPELTAADCARELLDMFRVAEALGHPVPPVTEALLALPWLDPPGREVLEAHLHQISVAQLVDEQGGLTQKGMLVARMPLPLGLALAAAEARCVAGEWWLEITALCLIVAEGLVERLSDSCGLETICRAYCELQAAGAGTLAGASAPIQRISATLRNLSGSQRIRLKGLERCAPELLGRCFFSGAAARVGLCQQPGRLVHCSGEVFEAPGIDDVGGFYLILDAVRLRQARQGAPVKRVTFAVSVDTLQLLDAPAGRELQEGSRIVATPVSTQDARVVRVQCVAETRYGELVLDSQTLSVEGGGFRAPLKVWLSERYAADVLSAEPVVRFKMRLNALPPEVKSMPIVTQCLSDLSAASADLLERLADHLVAFSRQSGLSIVWDPDALLRPDVLPLWLFPYELSALVNGAAPESLVLENGRNVAVEYTVDGVFLVGRIQEFYGVSTHPRMGRGNLSPRLRLLAPNGQTAQITSDLKAFWATSYAEVRKAYAGRYPKHHWPADPAHAQPHLTNRQARAAAETGAAGAAPESRGGRQSGGRSPRR